MQWPVAYCWFSGLPWALHCFACCWRRYCHRLLLCAQIRVDYVTLRKYFAYSPIQLFLYGDIFNIIPSDLELDSSQMFDPVVMEKRFERGYQMSLTGDPWLNAPPGYRD